MRKWQVTPSATTLPCTG